MTCPRCARSWPHLHVTEVLRRAGLLDVSWASPEAMTRGTYVHQAIALGDRMDPASIDPAWAGYYLAWQSWMRDSGAVVLYSEIPVEDQARGYVGTADATVALNGHDYLIDWKSGIAPASVGPQTAAYARVLGQRRRACVELHADGTYRFIALTDRADERIFLAALEVSQWQLTHS